VKVQQQDVALTVRNLHLSKSDCQLIGGNIFDWNGTTLRNITLAIGHIASGFGKLTKLGNGNFRTRNMKRLNGHLGLFWSQIIWDSPNPSIHSSKFTIVGVAAHTFWSGAAEPDDRAEHLMVHKASGRYEKTAATLSVIVPIGNISVDSADKCTDIPDRDIN